MELDDEPVENVDEPEPNAEHIAHHSPTARADVVVMADRRTRLMAVLSLVRYTRRRPLTALYVYRVEGICGAPIPSVTDDGFDQKLEALRTAIRSQPDTPPSREPSPGQWRRAYMKRYRELRARSGK